MVRTPVAFVMVKTAVPVFSASMLWLNVIELGLITATHCGIGVAEGDATGVAVGVGVAFPLPFPLLLPELPEPFPFPLFPLGVAVGVGVAVGLGLAPSCGVGVAVGLGDDVGVGVGVEWSTSSVTAAKVTAGMLSSGKCCSSTVMSPELETSTGILFPV